MNRYVTDTHAMIWHLQNHPNLSTEVRQIFLQADEGTAPVVIPTIVLVEMVYLAEKTRIPEDLLDSTLNIIGTDSMNYEYATLDFSVVSSLRLIPLRSPGYAGPYHCSYSTCPGFAAVEPGFSH